MIEIDVLLEPAKPVIGVAVVIGVGNGDCRRSGVIGLSNGDRKRSGVIGVCTSDSKSSGVFKINKGGEKVGVERRSGISGVSNGISRSSVCCYKRQQWRQ